MRETTGCGEHLPETRTFYECSTVNPAKIKNKSAEEVKSMLDEISTKFQDSFSTLDASKLKQMEYLVKGFIGIPTHNDPQYTVSIDFYQQFSLNFIIISPFF